MPPLPDVAGVVKVALVWSDGINVDIVTRFYLKYSGSAPSNSELDTFASGVHSEWLANLAGGTTEAIALIAVECIDLTTPSASAGAWSGNEPGTATDPPNAMDVAVVSSYVIARRYRGGHPRGYWPLGTAAQLATPQTWDGSFIAAQHTALDTFFANVKANVWSGGGTMDHVNVSYFAGFTVVTDPLTGRARNVPTLRGTPIVDTITTRIERVRVGTQRRRLQY